MKVGSVIIDLASEFGGNCELTKHEDVGRAQFMEHSQFERAWPICR